MNRAQARAIYQPPIDAYVTGAASADLYATNYVSTTPLDSWRYNYVKRGLDMVVSLAMLIAFLPLGIGIAAAVLLTSPGPVFYREERIGRGGKPFKIWKFRTMQRNAHSCGNVLPFRMRKHQLHLTDPRITSIGGFLRRWSLDELPQFLNVLTGDMSIIGPRPIVEAETFLYHRWLSAYLAATPGLSGLWQVSGRSNVDYSKRAEMDAMYVSNWSLRSDFAIVMHTIPAVLRRTGAR